MNREYGNFLFEQGRYAEAKIQYKIVLKHHPKSANNHLSLSKTLLHLDQYHESRYHHLNFVSINPNLTEALILKVRCNVKFYFFVFVCMSIHTFNF